MPPPLLDHIVLLLPHTLILHPPHWLTTHFTLTPGGFHTDKKTQNNLILFQDGSYIELIAFVDDSAENKRGHRWGGREVGVIDFAFITGDGAWGHWEGLRRRLEALGGGDANVRYEEPKRGGRRRGDGVDVLWETTFPVVRKEEGKEGVPFPFFCHDVEPSNRGFRVPITKENTTHPCGAVGIEEVSILVPESEVGGVLKAYEAILDERNGAEGEGKEGVFKVGSVERIEGRAEKKIRVRVADEGEKKRIVDERGGLITDLVIGGLIGGKKVRLGGEYGVGDVWYPAR